MKFDEIAGQEGAINTLLHNIGKNKVASAYLFSGPHGTGKSTVAEIFAKALLCQQSGSESDIPCGKCKSCAMFETNSNPDFFGLKKEGAIEYEKSGREIIINQMRDLTNALSLKSYLGGRKVAVIYDTDTMKGAASNSFLKTLEEPPEKTVIILISANPQGLLPTIVSRCRVIPFVPMEPHKLARILIRRLGISEDEAIRVANLADGCVGRALGGVDEVRAIDDEAVSLMSRIGELRADEAINFALGWKDRRKDLPVLLARMAEVLRLSRRRNSAFSSAIMPEVLEKFDRTPGERVDECFDLLMESAPALWSNNPNVQLFLEALIFNMQSVLQKGKRIGTTYS
ncbi:MAG: DNA polymerase III subunit delta' [Nitrospinae bacterium]|nr:DNA polymerase III subunit delta' [Nitrospinota bacterium]